MDYGALRKLALKGFIGFLGLTAAIAIVFVLIDAFGELQVKVLATSLTISIASICAMSCAAFIERRRRVRLGLTGIALASLAGLLLIVGIWAEFETEAYWKITVTGIVAALGLAQAFLLLLPHLDARHAWVQRASTITIGVLVLQIIAAVWGEIENNFYFRVLTTVAILAGLETLIVPVLMKLRRGGGAVRRTLTLTHIEGETYRDSSGDVYHVRLVDAPERVSGERPLRSEL